MPALHYLCCSLATCVLIVGVLPCQAQDAKVVAVAQVIDREIDKELSADKVKVSPRADDAEFLRRVTLDITGVIPTVERAAAFLASDDPDKRRKLVDELLANPIHGDYFAGMWLDRINATGDPPFSTRAAFKTWLAKEFNQGRGWDKIVAAMIRAEGPPGTAPEGHFVRANLKEPGQLAETTARFFLGVQMQCAECHNHPFTQWTQQDYWGLAVFYSRVKQVSEKGGQRLTEEPIANKKPKAGADPLSIVIPTAGGNRGAGKIVKAKLLAGTTPLLPKEGALRPALAAWITAPDNPYFAQAAVNRMWAHFFGRGFFNPIDDFHKDAETSHPELMKLLAKEFVASGHDLKHLIRGIVNSEAYQRTSRPIAGNEKDETLYSHMAVRVMAPEVLFDSLVTAMGNPKLPGGLGAPIPYEVYSGGKVKGAKTKAREEFLRFFATNDDSGRTTEYTQGIPQVLALMNAKQFNGTPPIVEKLLKAKVSPEQGIETLCLATLSRRPSADELTLLRSYVDRVKDAEQGFRGVLWILFNTNEFVLIR